MIDKSWIEAGLTSRTGELIDRQAAKVFPAAAALWNHPIATYMARVAPRTRKGMVTYLKIARDILTDQPVSLAEFPWAKLEYPQMVLLRRTLLDRYPWQSVNHTLTFVLGVLKECWRLDLMPYEQYQRAISIESAKGLREIRGRYVRPQELAPLFALCAADIRPHGTRDAAMIALFYCTGRRRSELERLDVDDYDPTTREIVVRRDKLHRRRSAFIANEGKAALDEWIRLRSREPGPLFVTIHRKGYIQSRRMSGAQIGRIVRWRAQKAGLDCVRPHDLRRSFITGLLEMGVDLLTPQQLAGHINLASTVSYDIRGEAAMREAADMVSVPYVAKRPRAKPPKPKPVNAKAAKQAWELSTLHLGKYAWEILDALQGDRWVTISIPRQRTRVWYGKAAHSLPRGLVQKPEHQVTLKDPRQRQAYANRYDGLRRAFMSLEKHGLVRCDESGLSSGRHRDFAGYALTPLGKLVYRTACAAGMHRQRFQLSRLHERLTLALSKRMPRRPLGS